MEGDTSMSELTTSGGVRLFYRSLGEGPAVLALHGAYSAHEEILGFLDSMLPFHRRLYPDLPGMGNSTAEGVDSADAVVTVLEEFIDQVVGPEPLVIIGHSFGAHIARGIAARRPTQVRGLVLICPLIPNNAQPEKHVVLGDEGVAASLPPDQAEEFSGYFVVQTEETVDRFRTAVAPVLGRFDGEAVNLQMKSWALDPDPETSGYDQSVLVLTGRHDSTVGYRQHTALLDRYPRATSIVLAEAGHALPHEHPEVLEVALHRLLVRAGHERRS